MQTSLQGRKRHGTGDISSNHLKAPRLTKVENPTKVHRLYAATIREFYPDSNMILCNNIPQLTNTCSTTSKTAAFGNITTNGDECDEEVPLNNTKTSVTNGTCRHKTAERLNAPRRIDFYLKN